VRIFVARRARNSNVKMFKFAFNGSEAGNVDTPAALSTPVGKSDCSGFNFPDDFSSSGLRCEDVRIDDTVNLKKALRGSTAPELTLVTQGYSVWECSVDLAAYLASTTDLVANKRVLELGCGHGLPGIMCSVNQASTTVFQDLNLAVLREVTLPAVALNVIDSARRRTVRFVAGDWTSLLQRLDDPQLLGRESFDLVLAAETLSAIDVIPDFVALLCGVMAYPHGCALIATKQFYFGVGGGVVALQTALERANRDATRKLDLTELARFEDGR
jgi:SAM-dependent methyltransferase